MIDEQILKRIGRSYANGHFDAEACKILTLYVAEFEARRFADWLVSEPELAETVESGRILARAFWDAELVKAAGGDKQVQLPAWYSAADNEYMRQVKERLARREERARDRQAIAEE